MTTHRDWCLNVIRPTTKCNITIDDLSVEVCKSNAFHISRADNYAPAVSGPRKMTRFALGWLCVVWLGCNAHSTAADQSVVSSVRDHGRQAILQNGAEIFLEVVSKPAEHDHRTGNAVHGSDHVSVPHLADKESPEVKQLERGRKCRRW